MNDSGAETSVLFVCMGNICRSPAAEGFFNRHLARSDLAGRVRADSAGTHDYHIGHPPDARAVRCVSRFGVDISELRARRIRQEDFKEFDMILAMDQGNLQMLTGLGAAARYRDKLRLMMEFSPRFESVREVPDPYYGELDDFEYMCDLLDEATRGLVRALSREFDKGT